MKRLQNSLSTIRFYANQIVQSTLVACVRSYQLILSPLLGPRCRYYPSCSQYSIEVLKSHGPIHGGILTLRRLARCHPGHPGGIDFPPECGNHNENKHAGCGCSHSSGANT